MSSGNQNLGGTTITGMTGKMGAIIRGAGSRVGLDILGDVLPTFNAALQATLVPSAANGSPTPTFTRATAATVWGFQAADVTGASPSLITVASGEARFQGARRISQGVWSTTLADGAAINLVNTTGASAYVDANGPFGYLSEGARTQYLGATDTPATQTTASLGTGTYTLWVVGTGSATSSAGTATITGGGAATAGSPNTFTVTVAGTVVVTVAGSLTRFQLENGSFASSYIVNTGAAGTTAVRNADALTYASAGNLSATVATIYFEASFTNLAMSNRGIIIDSAGASNPTNIINNTTWRVFDGSTIHDFTVAAISLNTVHKCAVAYGNTETVAIDGVSPASQSFDGNMDLGAFFAIGYVGTPIFSTIRNIKIYPVALSAAKLQAMTT